MEAVNTCREKYGSLDILFSEVFHHAIKNKGISLIVVEDTVIKEEFTGFVSQRNGVVLDNPDKGTYGFLVRKDFGDDLIMSRVSSIEIITLNSEFLLDRVFPANIPCLIASLDMELANLDFWNDKEIVHDRDQYPAIQCFLMNDDLKKMFLKTFYIAEKEIDIICPWLNRHVINERFIRLISMAVSKGVIIKITYGIGNDEEDERKRTTEKTVEMLRRRFDGNKVMFHRGNTHIKYLICDNKYMMCGSYNLLSFAADYEVEELHDEGMEYIIDQSQIMQRRKQLFSW